VGDVELVELEVPMLSSEDGGCDSDFGCSEWGECKIDYNFEDLVLGVEKITGEQRRFCEDSADCVADRIQERKCSVVLGIYAEEKEWCEENYLWIYDKDTDELLGRIKNRKLEEIPSLDIEFLNSRPEFCDYCYNEIQDKDETGIDCGGSCEKCVDIFYSPSLFDDVMRWLGF